MNLVGKSREQIEIATKDLTRQEMITELYKLACCEPYLRVAELAARRGMSKDKVKQLIHAGKLRAHLSTENSYRIPLSSIQEWDRSTRLFFVPNKSNDTERSNTT